MNNGIKRLADILSVERITVEENIEALDILAKLNLQLGQKEVYVKEPDDVNDDVQMTWTREQLQKLRELAVVAIANEMGIDASVRDRKNDTIEAILKKQAQRSV